MGQISNSLVFKFQKTGFQLDMRHEMQCKYKKVLHLAKLLINKTLILHKNRIIEYLFNTNLSIFKIKNKYSQLSPNLYIPKAIHSCSFFIIAIIYQIFFMSNENDSKLEFSVTKVP